MCGSINKNRPETFERSAKCTPWQVKKNNSKLFYNQGCDNFDWKHKYELRDTKLDAFWKKKLWPPRAVLSFLFIHCVWLPCRLASYLVCLICWERSPPPIQSIYVHSFHNFGWMRSCKFMGFRRDKLYPLYSFYRQFLAS